MLSCAPSNKLTKGNVKHAVTIKKSMDRVVLPTAAVITLFTLYLLFQA